MARDGWAFVGPAAAVTVIGWWLTVKVGSWGWPVLIIGGLAVVFLTYFFRDPERIAPDDPEVVVATADGRVLKVLPHADGGIRIDTFLSVWDVHVNRAPVSGKVTASDYHPGRFLVAYKPEAATENERHDLVIEGDIGTIRSAQIAGILARRIVCRARTGDQVRCGDRIGMIRFGSRAEVHVPDGFVAVVAQGERVRAGETVIARRIFASRKGPMVS